MKRSKNLFVHVFGPRVGTRVSILLMTMMIRESQFPRAHFRRTEARLRECRFGRRSTSRGAAPVIRYMSERPLDFALPKIRVAMAVSMMLITVKRSVGGGS